MLYRKFDSHLLHRAQENTQQQNQGETRKYRAPSDSHSMVGPMIAAGSGDSRDREKAHHSSWLTSVGFGSDRPEDPIQLSEQQLKWAVACFARYLREEREHYYPQGQGLSADAKKFYGSYFPAPLLEQVRVVALAGRRISNPSFYQEARALGLMNLPDITHKDSVTFLDALVFNERVTDRILFHALVHATQVRTLGIYLFADLFVRGFLRTKSYSMVPLKAQAFELDMRYASDKSAIFSVEDEVFRWLMAKRY